VPARDLVMVAGLIDSDRVTRNRVVYVEHGAGQSYVGLQANVRAFYPHSPSLHHRRVIGYVSPRQSIADGWGRPAVAAGAPCLDALERGAYSGTVAITFHWDAARVAPEARSAKPHYFERLHEIVGWIRDAGFKPLGHGHPRDVHAADIWHRLEVEFDPDPDSVLERAACVIADNTSLIYEAAAMDIPVLTLNAPWYRRDVHHGLRFWDAIPGLAVDGPDELLSVDLADYILADYHVEDRWAAASAAYDHVGDRKASQRAAEFLVQLAERR
jgi:hypothetical protein